MTAAEDMLPHYYRMHSAVSENRNFDLGIDPKKKNINTTPIAAIFEPWFCRPSNALLESVMDFVKFLKDHTDRGNKEISVKKSQLTAWSQMASQLLKMNPVYGYNYVDNFVVKKQGFELFDVNVNAQVYKVFMVWPKDGEYNVYEDEEKSNVFSSSMATGFILKKCLRKVRTTMEQRDIYTAIRCEICTQAKRIIRTYQEEKFIIKKVAKTSSPTYNERLRREFKVQSIFTELDFYGINKLYSYHEDELSIFTVSYSAGNMDLLENLQQHVHLHSKGYSEDIASKLFKSAVQSFVVAHNLGICHRDISMENLVVNDINDMKNPFLEVIDWGHSASMFVNGDASSRDIKYEGPVGKERYFAPELLKEFRDPNDKYYDPFKADVFAFGVCLFSALLGQMPFSTVNDQRASYLNSPQGLGVSSLLKFINQENKLSETALDLLNKCMNWNPESRPSFDEILNHAFFKI